MTDNEREELKSKFPWLAFLELTAHSVVNTLFRKERDYQGSWQRRGGIGAFMMLARKWDRIETIAKTHSYDIIEAGVQNTGDVCDDIDDLIGYLMLVRSEIARRAEAGAEPTAGYVSQEGFGTKKVIEDAVRGNPDDPLRRGGIRGVSLE